MSSEEKIEEMEADIALSCPELSESGCARKSCIPCLANAMSDMGYDKRETGEWILVAPRRTGRNATFKCSVCGKKVSSYYNDVGEWKCCPHCESKMKRGLK